MRVLKNFGAMTNQALAVGIRVLIQGYRLLISPLLPARCRFYPTCSSYGLEAIRLHGGFHGGWLTLKRVGRCHPWGDSGVDFVPLPLYRYHYQYVGWVTYAPYHSQLGEGRIAC